MPRLNHEASGVTPVSPLTVCVTVIERKLAGGLHPILQEEPFVTKLRKLEWLAGIATVLVNSVAVLAFVATSSQIDTFSSRQLSVLEFVYVVLELFCVQAVGCMAHSEKPNRVLLCRVVTISFMILHILLACFIALRLFSQQIYWSWILVPVQLALLIWLLIVLRKDQKAP
jgi:hypothetical protein